MTDDKYQNSRLDGRWLYLAAIALMFSEVFYLKSATSLLLGIPLMFGHAGWRNHVINGKTE